MALAPKMSCAALAPEGRAIIALPSTAANGTISRETVINPGPNQVKAIEGKVNTRDVWVRVEPVDQKITSVTVQVRNKAGTDQQLTQELQKQIAVNLATR